MTTESTQILLSHLIVGIAAHVPPAGRPVTPRHLPNTLECIRTWHKIVGKVELTVFTNNGSAVWPVVKQSLLPLPQGWKVAVTSSEAGAVTDLRVRRRANPFGLTHAHLHSWAAIVADLTSTASAFVHLEDDVCPSADSLLSWARDTALLQAAGASDAGFQRGFYRYEVTRPAHEMQWHRVKGLKTASASATKYTAEFINTRAAQWRAAHNVSLGERFLLDERLHRRFKSSTCDGLPCRLDGKPDGSPGTSSGRVLAASNVNVSGSTASWCSNYPTLVVHPPGQQKPRAFVALSNPYSAITAARRELVATFLLHSRGWNTRWTNTSTQTVVGARSTNSTAPFGTEPDRTTHRTRYKAYGVREYGSGTFDYAHEFVHFQSAGDWPAGQLDDVLKVSKGHRGGMRRVLVPLVHDGSRPLHLRWRLDTIAGVHHMSDRVVNGPRKGWVEMSSARYREHEVVHCTTLSTGPW
jgi:hypothetical protein